VNHLVLSGALSFVLSGAARTCYQAHGFDLNTGPQKRFLLRNRTNKESYGFSANKHNTLAMWITREGAQP